MSSGDNVELVRRVFAASSGGRSDAVWDEFLVEADEFRDLGARVLVLGRVHARGAESGIELHGPGGRARRRRGAKVASERALV